MPTNFADEHVKTHVFAGGNGLGKAGVEFVTASKGNGGFGLVDAQSGVSAPVRNLAQNCECLVVTGNVSPVSRRISTGSSVPVFATGNGSVQRTSGFIVSLEGQL